jgi:hypothetical protein
MFETHMEDLIATFPDDFLNEPGLRLIARQYKIGNYIFDLLFEDRHGGKLIVELQRGVLNRDHCYKIFDYFDEYKSRYPDQFIDICIVANEITSERKKMLAAKGIKFLEIPEKDFIEKRAASSFLALTMPLQIRKPFSANLSDLAPPQRRGIYKDLRDNKYFLSSEEFRVKLTSYIKRGKRTQDKIARKKLILDIMKEYLKSENKYLTAQYIFDFIKSGNYQQDYCNSFFRLVYYPLLVSDELFNGKNFAEKVHDDAVTPRNLKYPEFKVLESDDYNLRAIKLRLNINKESSYKKTLESLIEHIENIDP